MGCHCLLQEIQGSNLRLLHWRVDALPLSYQEVLQANSVTYFRIFCMWVHIFPGFPGGSEGKESVCSVGDTDLIPGSGRSPGEGNGSALQDSCLENHGQRSLAGYGLQSMGRKEPDTIKRLHFQFPFSHSPTYHSLAQMFQRNQRKINCFKCVLTEGPLEVKDVTQVVLWWQPDHLPGTAEPGGLPSMGSHRVGHDWSNLAAAAAADHQYHSFPP